MSLTLFHHMIRLLFGDEWRSDSLGLNLLRILNSKRLDLFRIKYSGRQISLFGFLSNKRPCLVWHIMIIKAQLLDVIQDQTQIFGGLVRTLKHTYFSIIFVEEVIRLLI